MKNLRLFIIVLASLLLLSGCAAKRFFSMDDAGQSAYGQEQEKPLSDRYRQCVDERRKLELALREAQRRNDDIQRKLDETQRKLDAVVGIERSLRKKPATATKGE